MFCSCSRELRVVKKQQTLIIELLKHLIKEENLMTAEFDALKAEVARAVTVVEAAVAHVHAVTAEDPAALVALTATLKTSTDALAAVVQPPAT